MQYTENCFKLVWMQTGQSGRVPVIIENWVESAGRRVSSLIWRHLELPWKQVCFNTTANTWALCVLTVQLKPVLSEHRSQHFITTTICFHCAASSSLSSVYITQLSLLPRSPPVLLLLPALYFLFFPCFVLRLLSPLVFRFPSSSPFTCKTNT